MPNDTNTAPRDLEDAIGRMLDAYPHMTRGDAVERISQGITEKDPKFASIPNVTDDLATIRHRAFAHDALVGFDTGVKAIPNAVASVPSTLLGLIPGLRNMNEWARQGREMSPLSKYESDRHNIGPESPIGGLVGNVASFMVPGVGPSGVLEDVGKVTPYISKLMAAQGLPARMARGAGEGALLGKLGAFGDPDEPVAIPGTDWQTSQAVSGGVMGGAAPAVSDVLGKTWNTIARRWAKSPEYIGPIQPPPTKADWKAGQRRPSGPTDPPDPPGGGAAAGPPPAPKAPPYTGGPTSIAEQPTIGLTPGMRMDTKFTSGGDPQVAVGAFPDPGLGYKTMGEKLHALEHGDLAAGLMPDRPEQAPSWWKRAQLMPTEEGPTAGAEPVAGPGESVAPTQPTPGPVVPPVSEPTSRPWFISPRDRGFQKTAEERLRETGGEPIGTMNMREGQPFHIERHNELDTQRKGLKVYAYPTSSLGRAGRPTVVDLEKPMVIDVGSTGEQAFVDAAKALYADNQKVLDLLDRAKDRVGLSQELIARRAQKGGYDAVSLSTPDVSENVILGTKDFKMSPHPELDKATQASMNLRRPAARAATKTSKALEDVLSYSDVVVGKGSDKESEPAAPPPRSPFKPKPEVVPETIQEQRVAERAEARSRAAENDDLVLSRDEFGRWRLGDRGVRGQLHASPETTAEEALADARNGPNETVGYSGRKVRLAEGVRESGISLAEQEEASRAREEASRARASAGSPFRPKGGTAPRSFQDVLEGFGWEAHPAREGVVPYDHSAHGGSIKVHPNGEWEYGLYGGKDAQSLFELLQAEGHDKWKGEGGQAVTPKLIKELMSKHTLGFVKEDGTVGVQSTGTKNPISTQVEGYKEGRVGFVTNDNKWVDRDGVFDLEQGPDGQWRKVLPEGGSQPFDPAALAKAMREAKETEAEARSAGPYAEVSGAQTSASAGLTDDVSTLHPQVQEFLERTHEARVGMLAEYRPVPSAIDHPLWQRALMNIVKTQAELNNFTKKFGKAFQEIFKDVPSGDFDETVRAMEGLKHDAEGNIVQSAIDVEPRHDELARKVKALTDEAYTILTGNDPRLPPLLERLGLKHNRKQLERLRILQTEGPARDALFATRKVGYGEEIAAGASKGWLGFDASHDLDIVPWKGFLSFYPVENERAKVQDAINMMQSQKANGYSPTGMAELDASLKKHQERLAYIDEQVRKEPYRRLPNQDNIPKYRFMAPLKSMRSSAAKALFLDMDVPKISTKFISSVLDKRQSDVVLFEMGQLMHHPDFQLADVKQFMTDYSNTVRGSRGYRGDARFAQHWNRAFGKVYKLSPQQVHNMTSYMMDFQSTTKIRLFPVRFPIINLTHMFVSLYPVAGEKIFAQALADVLGNPQRWFDEAGEAGAIQAERDYMREVGDPNTVMAKGPLKRAWDAPIRVTENLRRAVAYRAGLLTEPSEWSPLVKAFHPDGHASLLEARKAYARGLVLTTQFDMSLINKPIGFTGSPFRRLASQFRTWPVSLGNLYADMARKGQWGSLARGMAALYLFGGPSAALFVGPSIWGFIRDHLMRHGHHVGDESGLENVADTLGFQGTSFGAVLGMNLGSLHDPLALVPKSVHSLAGPAIGSVWDAKDQVTKAIQDEDYGSLYGIALELISPQVRAAVQAGQEFYNGGKVFGPSGHLEMTRPLNATILRGFDLLPSSRSIRYNDMQDIAAAMESGNQKLVAETRSKAKRDGVMMDGHFEAGLRAILKKRKGSVFKRQSVTF